MTDTIETIMRAAARSGVRIEPRGNMLALIPKGKCPPDLRVAIRQNKAALLSWFEARSGGLPADCVPWLHIAKQVLAGEFDNADNSTRQSLAIGLRSIQHPQCQKAFQHITSSP